MTQAQLWDRVETVEIEGLQIAYRRTGDGPALVLLHGGPTDSREFHYQLEGLSDEFTVVAWDRPGCGRSSDPPESFRIPDYVRIFFAFLQALGIEQPHVLGLSFGSGYALELYRAHPVIPQSLILASAYAGWAGSLPPDVVEQRKQGLLQRIEQPDVWVHEWLPTLLTDAAPRELVEEVSAILADYHPGAQRALLSSGFAEQDLRDVLPTVTVPTLLLYGDKDVRSPLNVAQEMHASIPGSQLVIMPGAPHLSDMEAPDRFNAEVRSFLHSIGGSAESRVLGR